MLLTAAYFSGSGIHYLFSQPTTVLPASSSSEGNWGLSFQEEGVRPVGNATPSELAKYQAAYADETDEKVIYLTFDAGYENGNLPAILDALKTIRRLALSLSSEIFWKPVRNLPNAW